MHTVAKLYFDRSIMTGTKFKSRLMFAVFLFLLICVLGDNATFAHRRVKRTLPLASSTERIQLLEDALGWMTFRINGRLMTNEELAPLFFKKLKRYYISSKFYRTFVIAFEQGVLPRLTLNENEACNPGYTWEYKDPFNTSVTWHFQKQFTFTKYKNRKSSDAKFCDYRQGLICKPTTQKCQCPEGSKMQPISPGNPVKRCLLEENEICALIDIDHGVDPKHTDLSNNLHQMIFNLEKPVSCKAGTQCRFKSTDVTLSRCYNVNSGPWGPPFVNDYGDIFDDLSRDFGTECVLGLIASPGSCSRHQWFQDRIGFGKGYTCYNFGPPRSLRFSSSARENRTGICAHDWGRYGVYESSIFPNSYYPLFSPFVNFRTVPLGEDELADFFRKYLDIIGNYFFLGSGTNEEREVGGTCSVSTTEIFEKSWSYFASLEDDPPPGKDFVPQATKSELYANLEPVINVTKEKSKKACRIFRKYNWGYNRWDDSLRCVAQGPPDAAGNDGICQHPGKVNTNAYAEKYYRFVDQTQLSREGLRKQEKNYDRDILLDYPDGLCLPELGPAPKTRSLGDVLEGGYCADGFVCYKDYSYTRKKYDWDCNLQTSQDNLGYVCLESGDEIEYSRCEAEWQDKLLTQELEKVGEYAALNKGEKCAYDIESSIRNRIIDQPFTTNKYKILSWMETTKMSGGKEGGLCDRTKLLECKETGICECFKNTQPRTVTVDGVVYYSDYCYVPTGRCHIDLTIAIKDQNCPGSCQRASNPARLTNLEKLKIWAFYGEVSLYSGCNYQNLCVYVNTANFECTTKNTGKTGYDLEPDPNANPGNNKYPGWHKSGGCSLCINERLVGTLLIGMFLYTLKLMPFSR